MGLIANTWDKDASWRMTRRFLKWRKINRKKYQYLRNYNITLEEVKALKEKQNNACAICFKPFTNSKKTHIDHDHYTMKVRGILCSNCNLGLGNFKDDIESLQEAIRYLSRRETAND